MKRRLMAVLMACVMTLSLLPISALSADSGMVFTKDARVNEDGKSYTISMEAWATGKTTTSTTTVPLDIALVLDVSGSMDDPFAGTRQKKINALKTAVNGFIEGVAAKSPDSNISIVKFAGDMANWVGNDTYWDSGHRYNYTQIVRKLTPAGTGMSDLKAAVSSLKPAGATPADYGMQLASGELASSTSGNSKVVVMFTDGEPNYYSGFDNSVAARAVNTARSMKAGGTTIYTVGVFTNPSEKVIDYMNATSSNYPQATATDNFDVTWGEGSDKGYYKTASDATELNNIFETIIDNISSAANAALNASTTVVDTLSEYFTFANTPGGDVKVYTVNNVNNGTEWAAEKTDITESVNVTVADKQISVTGYNYAANYVHGTEGQKLIIEITVVPSGIGCASSEIPTNADGNMPAAQVVLNQTVVTSAPGKTITGHAVIYDLNGGQSEKDFPTLYYPAGATVPVTGNVPTKDNHKFTGWMRDNAIVAANTPLEILSDNITLVAQWELSTHSVTGTIDENGTVNNDNQTVNHGGACENMVFTPNPGYKIASVTVNGTGVPFTPDANRTYTYSNEHVTENIEVVVTTEIDDSQTKDTKYTVRYTIEGVEQENDKVEVEGSAWINDEPAMIAIAEGGIPTPSNKYNGYKLDPANPEYPAAGTPVESGSEYTVNYVKDDSQTKDTKYTVHYTIEGVEQEKDKVEVKGSAWINDEPAMIAIAEGGIPTPSNKYNGYKLDPANPEYPAAGTPVESGSEYTVNYVKDDSQTKDTKYTVRYTIEGVEQENDKIEVEGSAWVNDDPAMIAIAEGGIPTPSNKYNGYKLDPANPEYPAAGTPVKSGSEYTVNYVKDDSQTQPTKYTVRYTIEGVEQENDKIEVEGSAWVNDEPAMIAIAEGGIPTPSNKYNGYKLDPANPEYPAAGTPVESGSEYTVNYVKRTDLSYTVHYYLKDTTTKLADDKVVIDQTFGVAVTEKALDIAGYNVFGESEKTITIGVGANEIIFYYTRVVYPYVPVVKPALNRDDHYAYVVGYPDGMVRPSGNITRAEAATIFFRLLTDDSRNQFWMTTNAYSDVNRGDWFNNAVSTLSNAGIISGYPDGTFRPNAPITRAEMSKIIALFAKLNKSEDRFNDIAGHWAEAYIKLAAGNGWIAGYPDGSFKPQQNITRAETMTMINRVLERVPSVESHLLPYNAMLTFPDCQSGQWFYIAVQEATNSHTYERAASEKNGDEQWIALRANRDWTQFQN